MIGQLVRQAYGKNIYNYNTEIPHGIKSEEMSVEDKSIYAFDPISKVAAIYAEKPLNLSDRMFMNYSIGKEVSFECTSASREK